VYALSRMPEEIRPSRGSSRTLILGIVAGGVACAAIGLLVARAGGKDTGTSRSAVKAAWTIDDGAALVALETFTSTHRELRQTGAALSVLDLATGQVRARVRLATAETRLVAATGDALWLWDPQAGLHRRAVATLAVDRTQAAWAGDRTIARVVGVDAGAIQVLDDQGRAWWLDTATLAVRAGDARMDLRTPRSITDGTPTTLDATFVDAAGDEQRASWIGMPRAGLRCGRGGAVSPDTLLHAAFVQVAGADDGVWLADPPAALAVYEASLDADPPLVLARVPCAGAPAWTAALPSGKLRAVDVTDDAVTVLVGAGQGDTALRIGLADGAVRWTHTY